MEISNLSSMLIFGDSTSHGIEQNSQVVQSLSKKESLPLTHQTIATSGLILDYTKNQIDETAMSTLINLAKEKNIIKQRDAMYRGEKINTSENRAVLHTALRALKTANILLDGENIIPKIHHVLDKMRELTEQIHNGTWTGYTGKTITDIVNIGIGGSDLGPRMVCHALRHYHTGHINTHFIANIDGHELHHLLKHLKVETTLFIISSKSFKTQETLMNAKTVRNWILNASQATEKDLAKHLIAVTANTKAAQNFGIPKNNIYPIWDWVGGRFSVWSAIGLPVMLTIGYNHFMAFLSGAHTMDIHFKHAPLEKNMPIILALIGIWHINIKNRTTQIIAPYHEDLKYLPQWLQQLEMESNGKNIQKNGNPVTVNTAPLIIGSTGTNGQHSYFQHLHQGTIISPVDFIAVLTPNHPYDAHHALLLANCFAQSEALMQGSQPNPTQNLKDKQKHLEGGRPSNTLLMNTLTPETLGALMALYEHKVFVQGVIWNVNSFDQMGVELGKTLAADIYQELTEGSTLNHDVSTMGLVELAKAALGKLA